MKEWNVNMEEFRDYLRLERSLSENSILAYISDIEKLRQFAEISEWNLTPLELEQTHLQDFLEYIFELGMSTHSQARILAGVKAFYRFLIYHDVIDEDPAVLLEGPRLTRKLPDTLSYPEIERLLNAIDLSTPEGMRNRAIIETLYSSGLRVSELTHLKMSHVYADIGFLRILGKGDKERLVPIGKDALKYIKIYIDTVRIHLQIESGHENIVFLNRRGTKLSRVMIFNIVKDLSDAIGLQKNISPHTFRHSFATHLIEGGANLRAVQDMLGHVSITTTEIYTHLDRDYLRQVILEHHPRAQKSDEQTDNNPPN
jgi:integrase/recombinase XerD